MLSFDQVAAHCLTHAGAYKDYPFDEVTLVIKVCGRMFAIMYENKQPATISLKCEPMLADLLRKSYRAVAPGYHLNKRLWNTVTLDGSVPDCEILSMIDHSYSEVVAKLTKNARLALEFSQK